MASNIVRKASHLLERFNRSLTPIQQSSTFFGQAYLARGSFEKLYVEMILKFSNPAAHAAERNAQPLRRLPITLV
nr:hypothetical protein [Ruegeria arenilitoris]